MIVVVDYGMGNVGSILNMMKRLGVKAMISSSTSDIEAATKLILPGVGSFDRGMSNIESLGLLPILHHKAMEERVPTLGICLGMQMLTKGSEEGSRSGLGWIDGYTVRFRASRMPPSLKIPHMGWNTVIPETEACLFDGLDPDHGFYFVHSYHVECADPTDVLATSTHGYSFAASIRRGNVFGTQFHPEKSHRHGLRLLSNFVTMSGC